LLAARIAAVYLLFLLAWNRSYYFLCYSHADSDRVCTWGNWAIQDNRKKTLPIIGLVLSVLNLIGLCLVIVLWAIFGASAA
jgi:hypothetical protein